MDIKKKLFLIQRILKEMEGGYADLWQIYKLMYFIDFEFYNRFKKSVSGAEYYNWQYGPMPYKNDADYAKNNLVDLGEKKNLWKKVDEAGKTIQINLQKIHGPEMGDAFSTEEEMIISEILEKYKKLSGKELVDLSHGDMPWIMTSDKEKIEYEYVNWRDTSETTVEDITKLVLS